MLNLRVVVILVALASLALFLWGRYRARSRSGTPIPSLWVGLIPAAILVGNVPALVWPADARIRIAASILSIVLSVAALVLFFVQSRSSSQRQRPM